jgi:hexosaminidase
MDVRLSGLIPQPVTVRPHPEGGRLELTAAPDVRPVAADAAAGSEHGAEAARAGAAVRRLFAQVPWPAGSEPGPSVPSAATGQVSCTVGIDAGLGPEEYRLSIGPDGIAISAGGEPGAIYAAQTIRQLLPADAWRSAPLAAADGDDSWLLPYAEIQDAPALSWRGAHLDVARHFMTKRELLAVIDGLGALKLNRLHLHLTDDQGWRFESKLHPRVHEIGSHRPSSRISLNREEPRVYDEIPHGGYYTLADLAEIAAFARQRGMEVVPEVDLPGHTTALLAALPELGAGPPPEGGYQVTPDWGIFPNLVAPLPQTMAVLRDLLGELIGATGCRFLHIGGDECLLGRWRDDDRVEAVRSGRALATAEELHASFLRDLADLLASDFGVRAVVWDEGFTSATATAGLRPDTVVMAWRGMPIALSAATAGHDVVASPVLPTYFDYFQGRGDDEPVAIGGPVTLEDVAGFAPVPADWPEQARARLIGTQFQVWTEYIPDGRALEYMIFPRACAFAEVAWSGGPVPLGEGAGGGPALADRIGVHLGRLDAAGLEYRPLAGPHPWQAGGSGPRRHRAGYEVQAVAEHLDQLAAGKDH